MGTYVTKLVTTSTRIPPASQDVIVNLDIEKMNHIGRRPSASSLNNLRGTCGIDQSASSNVTQRRTIKVSGAGRGGADKGKNPGLP
jgi:hypothetical protein